MSKKGEPVLRWNGSEKEGTTEQAEWSSSAANDTGRGDLDSVQIFEYLDKYYSYDEPGVIV